MKSECCFILTLIPGVPPRLLAAPWPAPVPGEAPGGAGPGGGRQDLGAPQSAARHRRALGGGARRRRGVPAGAAPGQPRPAQPAQGRAGRAARSDNTLLLMDLVYKYSMPFPKTDL